VVPDHGEIDNRSQDLLKKANDISDIEEEMIDDLAGLNDWSDVVDLKII